MKLTVKNTIVKEDITDEQGRKIGTIEFDPTDATIYKKFLNLISMIEEKAKIDKKIGGLQDIPNIKLTNVNEIEKYRGIFNKLEEKIDNYIDIEKEIRDTCDEIFGNVRDAFNKVSKSLDPYIQLIEWATPYFKNGREDKLKEYLNDEEEGNVL